MQKDKMLYSVLPLNHLLTGPGACLMRKGPHSLGKAAAPQSEQGKYGKGPLPNVQPAIECAHPSTLSPEPTLVRLGSSRQGRWLPSRTHRPPSTVRSAHANPLAHGASRNKLMQPQQPPEGPADAAAWPCCSVPRHPPTIGPLASPTQKLRSRARTPQLAGEPCGPHRQPYLAAGQTPQRRSRESRWPGAP